MCCLCPQCVFAPRWGNRLLQSRDSFKWRTVKPPGKIQRKHQVKEVQGTAPEGGKAMAHGAHKRLV